jgi:GMP synthase-like glutamine amidotransferase
MKVLIIDNKSAHLENLKHLLEEKLGVTEFTCQDPRVVQAKDIEPVDLVVISGGTGRSIVKNPLTFKRAIQILEDYKKPTIGICLGAEAIAASYGGELVEMPVRRVGNIRIQLDDEIAREIDKPDAIVYQFHKWLIGDLPSCLLSIASSKDGVEVLRHKSLPFYGVQFHPEVRRRDNQGYIIFEFVLDQLGLIQRNAHAIVNK